MSIVKDLNKLWKYNKKKFEMHPLLLKGDWNDYGVGGGH